MKKDDVIAKIQDFLIDEFELEESQLEMEALLKDDLEIESLDFVDIAVVVEKEFGIKIKGEEMTDVLTLHDLYEFIYNKVSSN